MLKLKHLKIEQQLQIKPQQKYRLMKASNYWWGWGWGGGGRGTEMHEKIMYNTELNDLRELFVLENLENQFKVFQYIIFH